MLSINLYFTQVMYVIEENFRYLSDIFNVRHVSVNGAEMYGHTCSSPVGTIQRLLNYSNIQSENYIENYTRIHYIFCFTI